MEQVHQLLSNRWSKQCKGPWGSLIVILAKPHQQHVTNINNLIWRICDSYRKLNVVTKPFQYPIPQCDESVTILNFGAHRIWIITLDARHGYHQVAVRTVDQEKLALFAPDNHKYCFSVIPFGPTYAHTFYSAMMSNFKDEWDELYIIQVKSLSYIT